MSRVKRVTLEDFNELLREARKSHLAKNEPIPQNGDIGVIDSCLNAPFATFGGKDLYVGFVKKAAILFYLLLKNHGLHNGNKRMAVLTLAYFFYINNKPFNIAIEDLKGIARSVATSYPETKDGVVKIIEQLIRFIIKNSNKFSN